MVLRIPPEAVATYQSDGSLSCTAMSVIRPAMLAGPIDRHWTLLIQSDSTFNVGGSTAAGLGSDFGAGVGDDADGTETAAFGSLAFGSLAFGCSIDFNFSTIFSSWLSMASSRSAFLPDFCFSGLGVCVSGLGVCVSGLGSFETS